MSRFVIVIPTRNRGFILEHAVQSVLAQTHNDLSLVVSDNASSDDTAQIIQRYARADRRVQAVRTERALSMPDSWEFALQHAKGEWILLLEDDGVLVSSALAQIDALICRETIDMVTFPFWNYYANETSLGACRNSLVTSPFSGACKKIESAHTAREIFQLRFAEYAPKMYNCVFRRVLLEQARARAGRLCIAPAPDYGGGAALLALTPTYVHIDVPLMLSNCGSTSPGASMRAYQQFQRDLGKDNETIASRIRLPFVSVCSIVPETLGRVRTAFSEFAPLDVPTEPFLLYFSKQLTMFERAGWSLPVERAALDSAVATLPIRTRIRVQLRSTRHRVVSAIDRFVRPRVWRSHALSKTYERLTRRLVIRGVDIGFADLSGARVAMERVLASTSEER